ncbi:MAG TPA: CocE/NonD family hydrolase [Geminicoccaceae bacterium]|nr:CocE/NonD family hydrolase [Geminicoccus sp.]HMU52194.1 CocE/NonD family hydrolase [Geminicoccaceae bacterium]
MAAAERQLLPVASPAEARLALPDGVELVSDIWRPEAPGRYPVMLMRQPYGRKIASTVVLAHPAWYAAHGYIVVVQDCRGRGDSGGAFRPLRDDAEDGAATLAWAADLPGCDGRVATYGFSYHAVTQLLALAGAGKAGSKRPDAMVPIMGSWRIRDDWAFEGGAFVHAVNQGWACQMAGEQARRAGDLDAFAALGTGVPQADLLGRYAAHTHYGDWLADEPATWRAMAPAAALREDPLDVPGFFIGGWLDGMLNGTLDAHAAFDRAAASPQRLLLGPWTHIPWGRRVGGLDLGSEASSPVDPAIVAFLDQVLKGIGEPGPRSRVFDIGGRRWRNRRHQGDGRLSLHLASGGLAAPTSTDGRLEEEPGPTGVDRLVHDPWRPAPSVGGHWAPTPGHVDRAAVDDRSDVAVYTSRPLDRPVLLLGEVAAELWVDCDRPSHDLACTLSMLHPDGRAITLSCGYLRVPDSHAPGPRRIVMRATCSTLAAGTALRLSIQAAASPAFAVNPGTGERPETAHAATALVITLAIAHGAATPSRLILSTSDLDA